MRAPAQPFRPFTAARRRLSTSQAVVVAIAAVALCVLTVAAPVSALRLLVLVHGLYAALFVALRLLTVLLAARTGPEPSPHAAAPLAHLPSFTLLCPLYRERDSLPNLLRSLSRLDYPSEHVEALLLIEEDDEETLSGSVVLPPFVRIVRVPAGGPKTKPNALNHGLTEAKGDIVGIYDAEDRPDRDQLRKVAARFMRGRRLACVQARLNYYNRNDGFLTRMFALEYGLHFDWFLPGLARLGLPLPLGGTSNFILRSALLEAGGWDPYNVTEDADLGLRLAELGYTMTTVESTTMEEATDTPPSWIRQRSRWIKGFMQTSFVHARTGKDWRTSLTLHGAIVAVVVSGLLNPLTWALFAASFLGFGGPLADVFSGGLGTAALVLFIGGNLAHVWLFMVAPLSRNWFTLSGHALFLPFYWLLQSVAAWKALFGFIGRPHYWEKTEHSAGEDVAREAAA